MTSVYHTSRFVPPSRMQWLMRAAQEHAPDLEFRLGRPVASGQLTSVSASDHARLVEALHAHFGVGARAALTRIGRQVFRLQAASAHFQAWKRVVAPFQSAPRRKAWVLDRIAHSLGAGPDQVRVDRAERGFWLVDETFDRTLGHMAAEPSCWLMVGELLEGLSWALGEEPAVMEVDCRAAGMDGCRFAVL